MAPARRKTATVHRETLLTLHSRHVADLSPEEAAAYFLESGQLLVRYFEDSPSEFSRAARTDALSRGDVYNIMRTRYAPGTTLPAGTAMCPACGCALVAVSAEASCFCESCGLQTEMVAEAESSAADAGKEQANPNYKKMSHWKDWLANFQGKETTIVPPEALEAVRAEAERLRIRRLSDCKVRAVLKTLSLNKYYDNIPQIIFRLGGPEPPRFTQEEEDTLIEMFKQIQTPFLRHCPKNRRNFIHCGVVLFKFCRQIGRDDVLDRIPMLKSRSKLIEIDEIWRPICKDLRWKFYPSV